MKVKQLVLDENQEPETILFEMTVEEAAYISKLTGRMNDAESNKLMRGGGSLNSSVYDGCCEVFNRYYEAGVDDYLKERR